MRAVACTVVALLAGCTDSRVDVSSAVHADQNRRALLTAVAELRAAHHAPAAFGAFAARLLALRGGMDETVAEEAELLAVTEALSAVRAATAAQVPVETVALTIWPLALAPPITAPVPGEPLADAWSRWMPARAETAAAYLERLCGGALALACKHIVPEGHGEVVGERVIERYTERARRAVVTCVTCSEPRWAEAIAGWEALDREATVRSAAVHEAYAPARWPVAGTGAVDLPAAGPALRHVHLAPGARAERVRYALADARAAGVAEVALIARAAAYPYRRLAYVLPTATTRLPVRDGEPVQVLLRALDAAATAASASADRRR